MTLINVPDILKHQQNLCKLGTKRVVGYERREEGIDTLLLKHLTVFLYFQTQIIEFDLFKTNF